MSDVLLSLSSARLLARLAEAERTFIASKTFFTPEDEMQLRALARVGVCRKSLKTNRPAYVLTDKGRAALRYTLEQVEVACQPSISLETTDS